MSSPSKPRPPVLPDLPFGPEDTPWQKGFSRLRVLDKAPLVSPPTADPRDVYPDVPEVPYGKVQLPPSGLDPDQYDEAQDLFHTYLERQANRAIGYQLTSNLGYSGRLGRYLDQHLNNVGDPYQSGAYTPNSKVLERAVLDYYASLWNAKWPHRDDDPDSYWGYLLTMGSSEGNLYGLWNARDCLAGRLLLRQRRAGQAVGEVYARATPRGDQGPNAFHPVAFFSQDTHYSLTKAVRVLGVDTFAEVGRERYPEENPLGPGTPWPTEVPSVGGVTGSGVIDVEKLAVLVRFFASRGYPILVNLNYGSTFKGAYDDVAAVSELVHSICAEYGLDQRSVHYAQPDGEADLVDVRPGFWIHVDSALGAGYAPFLEMARDAGMIDDAPPSFDFRLPHVHSLTMSAHKWVGAPWPCGVFMTRTGLTMIPPRASEYIGASDTTFAGSRNGLSAVVMWDYLARTSYDEQIRMAAACDRVAGYAHDRLLALQARLGLDLWVDRSPHALTVRFRRPIPEIVRKFSLSYETVQAEDGERPYVHLYAMKHVSCELIDELIHDLRRPGAFRDAAEPSSPSPG